MNVEFFNEQFLNVILFCQTVLMMAFELSLLPKVFFRGEEEAEEAVDGAEVLLFCTTMPKSTKLWFNRRPPFSTATAVMLAGFKLL